MTNIDMHTATPNRIQFNFDIRHRNQVLYGPKPETLFAVQAVGTSRAVPSDIAGDVSEELNTLCDRLNAELADAELNDVEVNDLAIVLSEKPPTGFDVETGSIYQVRRIDAYGGGSRAPHSRRALLKIAPTLAAFLDKVNGTEHDAIPLTRAEAAAQEAADEAAAELEHRHRLEQTAFDELMADAMEALNTRSRRRAAALINVVHGAPRAMRPEVLAKYLAREDFASDTQTAALADELAKT